MSDRDQAFGVGQINAFALSGLKAQVPRDQRKRRESSYFEPPAPVPPMHRGRALPRRWGGPHRTGAEPAALRE